MASAPSSSMICNPSRSVAVLNASRQSRCLIAKGRFALPNIALPRFAKMANPSSAKWFHCGVSLPVNSNSMSNFHASLSARFCRAMFSPPSSSRIYLTARAASFHRKVRQYVVSRKLRKETRRPEEKSFPFSVWLA